MMGRVLAAACLAAACSTAAVRAQAMRNVEYHAALDEHGNISIWNMAGSIRVTGWDRDSVIVRGVVPASQHFSCGGGGSGMKCAVDIAAKYDGKAPGASLELLVPRRVRLWVKSSSADIAITGFDGNLDAYSVSGRIHVEGNVQALVLESMAGALDVSAASSTLRAKTAGGDIRIRGDADDAQVTTVSGNIDVASRIRQGRFESIEGNTTFHAYEVPRATLEFSSHSGTIELRVPDTMAAEVSVSTFEGTFRSDVEVANRIQRETKGRELRFTLPGDHAARITIRNFKGPVLLLKQ